MVHTAVGHVVPQLESRFEEASHPFADEPSQSRVPAPQETHAPLVQIWAYTVHGTAEPHVPLAEQVSVALPAHRVVPGVHTPMHAPPTQADETQGVLLPHAPLDEHVSTLLLTHRVAFGVQTPVQLPPTHAWLEHGVPFCQTPPESHVCGVCPLHCLAPGVHAVQLPAVHTSGQADPLCQAPFESHVCGTSPLHCLVPGVHTPVHAPFTQA